MRPISIIITLGILVSNVSAQTDSITKALLNDVINRKSDTSVIAYLDKISPLMYDDMERFVRNKKVWDTKQKKYVFTLSKKEQKSILTQLASVRETVWDDNLFPKSERIIDDKFREYLKEHSTREVYIFSKPVFIRNNTIALFYLVRLCCGGVHGPIEWSYFKKTNDGWIQWDIVDESVL